MIHTGIWIEQCKLNKSMLVVNFQSLYFFSESVYNLLFWIYASVLVEGYSSKFYPRGGMPVYFMFADGVSQSTDRLIELFTLD